MLRALNSPRWTLLYVPFGAHLQRFTTTKLVCGEYYKDINNLSVLLSKCATNISVCYLCLICILCLLIHQFDCVNIFKFLLEPVLFVCIL